MPPQHPVSMAELSPRLDWQDRTLNKILLILEGPPNEPERGLVAKNTANTRDIESHKGHFIRIEEHLESHDVKLDEFKSDKDKRIGIGEATKTTFGNRQVWLIATVPPFLVGIFIVFLEYLFKVKA